MRWSVTIAVFVALGAYAHYRRHLPPWVEGALVVGCVLLFVVAHYRARRRFAADVQTVAVIDDPDRRADVIATLNPEHAAAIRLLSDLPLPDTDELERVHEFRYPPGSRGLNSWLFWLCVALALLFTVPIVRRGGLEFADSLVLFIMGALCVAGAWMYQSFRRWDGAVIRVGPDGIEALSPDHAPQSLDWAEIRGLRQPRGFASLEVVGGGKAGSIRLHASLEGYVQCLELIRRHLDKIAAGVA